MAFVEISNIAKRFGATVALDHVNIQLQKGEVHALIGENGAGKSTLMNILAGHIKPDSGTISLDGKPYIPSNPTDARRHGIALIHQELSLCHHLTVAENILLGMESSVAGWIDHREMRRRTLEVLKTFPHPDITPESRVSDLSIAARQVVEICRAVASKANIILMDEPTSSLQRYDVDQLFSLIRKLKHEGLCVVYISHFLEEIREIADRYTVLRDGKSISTGTLDSVTNDQIVAQMVGRSVESLYQPHQHPTSRDVLLQVRDLQCPGVKNASFDLHRGEVLGIAGLMGAGRTEMIRALFGLSPIKSGSILLNGKPLSLKDSPATRISQGFGYLSEDRGGEGLGLSLSIADNITATRYSTCSQFGWIDLGKQQSQAMDWVRTLAIKTNNALQPVRSLSGGNQQKVALARLMHQDIDILLLDEPTKGIDIGSKVQIYEAVERCVSAGKAVLLVSSYLPELFGKCDRLAVMCRGVLSQVRPIEEWTPESVLEMAIGGIQKGSDQ
ncbi:MAG TPA: sugar ABC transporter ATP-binding protein [Blastocatellia bacterium]|nr:sugar ABC transporter ATP-binding protein [Blastocatellia bacterium]